ncbi:MAG: YIP1 family protein [Limisphaera sp.]|nr:YIP1 family protein [Limisphaera sp.]
MSTDEPPVLGPQTPRTESWEPASYSVLARMVNVFAVPGEVFEDVLRSRPDRGNWFWPALLAFLVGFWGGWKLWPDPAVRHQIVRQQEAALNARVEAGRLTRERADAALQRLEQVFDSPLLRAAAGGVAGLGSSLRFVVWAVALWGVSRWAFGGNVSFGRACEVAGLASLVGVLGTWLEFLLWTPGATAPLGPEGGGPGPTPAPPRLPTTLVWVQSIFGFWQVAVMAVGLSKLARVPWVRGFWLLMGLWLFWLLVWAMAGGAR